MHALGLSGAQDLLAQVTQHMLEYKGSILNKAAAQTFLHISVWTSSAVRQQWTMQLHSDFQVT